MSRGCFTLRKHLTIGELADLMDTSGMSNAESLDNVNLPKGLYLKL